MGELFHDLDPDGDVILILQNPNVAFAVWNESQDYLPLPLVLAREESPSPALEAPYRKSKKKKGKFRATSEPVSEPEPVPLESAEPLELEPEPEPNPIPVESAQPLELDSSSNQDQPLAQEESSPLEQIASSSSPAEQNHSSWAATRLYSESLASPDETSSMVAETGQAGVRMRVSSSHLILASSYFKRMLRGGWKEDCTLCAEGCLTIYVEDWDPDALLILMNIIHGHTRKVPRTVSLEMLAKLAVLVDYYECIEVVEVLSEI
jgi:hypothetical protein